MRASSFVFEKRTSSFGACLKLWRGLQALCLSTEVVLRRGLWTLRLSITMVLRRGLRALHFAFERVALISLGSETWTLLSDDLSLVIFRQSINPNQKKKKTTRGRRKIHYNHLIYKNYRDSSRCLWIRVGLGVRSRERIQGSFSLEMRGVHLHWVIGGEWEMTRSL